MLCVCAYVCVHVCGCQARSLPVVQRIGTSAEGVLPRLFGVPAFVTGIDHRRQQSLVASALVCPENWRTLSPGPRPRSRRSLCTEPIEALPTPGPYLHRHQRERAPILRTEPCLVSCLRE